MPPGAAAGIWEDPRRASDDRTGVRRRSGLRPVPESRWRKGRDTTAIRLVRLRLTPPDRMTDATATPTFGRKRKAAPVDWKSKERSPASWTHSHEPPGQETTCLPVMTTAAQTGNGVWIPTDE